MTAAERTDNGLQARLGPVLPKGHQFGIFHLSTPPTKSAALYSAPPNERPDRTFCESHFLAVSIKIPKNDGVALLDENQRDVLILGVEILIYSTMHTTTLFVSKADSTGYLHLLKLPKGTPSPIREVCGAFLSHLVDNRRREGKQFIVSLFARAQSQYLFPGSVENSGKHVLDDRGLVKWWCRVLSPLLETSPKGDLQPWGSVKGYLVVPGLEEYETRAFLPRASLPSWSLTHPLERISHYTKELDWVPPRCLIPRYPDDPKSRFRDELDEEAAQTGGMRKAGAWQSVKTLDVFWEMMAFRQECSSGRMTGFIWVVFDDDPQDGSAPRAPDTPRKPRPSAAAASQRATEKRARDKKKLREKQARAKRKLRGPIVTRPPRVKTEHKNYLLARCPTATPHYAWPAGGRGERIVGEGVYRRIVELLLHLDFATLDKAAGSTRRWVGEVAMGSPATWGYEVTGTMEAVPPADVGKGGGDGVAVNNLSGLLVKRKRSAAEDGAAKTTTEAAPEGEEATAVNVLAAGLVRKKAKSEAPEEASVQVLSAGLVRKKDKA
ncbi:DNA damage response protein Rtt109 [Cordyceps fumosorosea ARSEF 2679]|uniref:histone acetyltransferase n=1 Tax=Cordyceps fumosorosea (strain ARSEF 2679) TaxID=1081104 RepID=A0A162N206_CORFA|nr:DNA damage response protein Rtt109 [Cordyceps fumosorosea ARSEF 2679]OAA74219.1 DNA damage response protein Rtt109 [Cordyceps fumosorosea ARSEF 2679]